MSDPSANTPIKIKELQWYEHVRKRPGMYIGRVDLGGFIEILKGALVSVITRTIADQVYIDLQTDRSARIIFRGLRKPLINNWSNHHYDPDPFWMTFLTLNALSEEFTTGFYNAKGEKLAQQHFKQGLQIEDELIDEIECDLFEVELKLDEVIWKEDLRWNEIYITDQLREFAYLHKRVRFEISYRADEDDCKIIYHFKNGLKDRIDIEELNGVGRSYLETAIDEKLGDIHLEAAFAFREYAVDEPYLRSYVNNFYTYEGGTHLDGLLKGLTRGIKTFFQKHQLTEVCKISKKGVKAHLLAALHVRMPAPVYSGSVRNKLANPEIMEPIAEYVAELLFRKIETDETVREKLIREFRI